MATGNGSDRSESCADDETVGLGIGIGIALSCDVSEMAKRLDKWLCGCGCGCGRCFLEGDEDCDFRIKERGWDNP